MFPILGAILNFSMQAAQETATKITVLIINRDTGENSAQFIEYLNYSMKVFTVNVSKIEDAVPLLTEYNATEIIEIPETFSQCLAAGENVTIKVYSVFSGAGLFEGARSSILEVQLNSLIENWLQIWLFQQNPLLLRGKLLKMWIRACLAV
jgi:hypothetical protein